MALRTSERVLQKYTSVNDPQSKIANVGFTYGQSYSIGWRVCVQIGLQDVDATHGISKSVHRALRAAAAKFLILRPTAETRAAARFATPSSALWLSLSLHEKISEQKVKVALAQKSRRR